MMNLAKLIAPHKYVLANELKFDVRTIKTMTSYDLKNIDQCHDMLEVILRAMHFGDELSDFIGKGLYDIDELNRYRQLVMKYLLLEIANIQKNFRKMSTEYFHKIKRYSDFSENIKWDQHTSFCETPGAYKHKEKFYLAIDAPDRDVAIFLDEISEWQADYINIFNVICSLGKAADIIGTEDQLCKIFANKTVDMDTDIEDLQVNDTKDTQVNDTKDTQTNTTTKAELENYKLLLGKNSNNWFKTAQKEAKLKFIQDTYIAVELDSNVLVFNTDQKYFRPGKRPDVDLAKYCIDDVKYVTIGGDENNFAYPGFVYDNVTYKITGLSHLHLYSYIASGRNNTDMISKDLINLINKLKTEVENLPDTEYCQDAKITSYKDYIKITHGPLVIHTYLEFKCQFLDKGKYNPERHNYIKSRMFAGKNKDKYYIFLQVGKHTYRYTGIANITAGEILMHRQLADSV